MNGSFLSMFRSRLTTSLIILINTSVLAAAVWAMTQAVQSPLFTLKVVEVSSLGQDAPVTADELIQLANVPVDRINLFSLDLVPIEKRILTHPWIRKVHLEKQFPQTLVIAPEFRQVRAMIVQPKGKSAYVDENAVVFGKVKLGVSTEFPVLSAKIYGGGTETIQRCLKIIENFEARIGDGARLESLDDQVTRGIQGWISYPLKNDRHRAQILFSDQPDDATFLRLQMVFKHLSERQISVSEIWTDLGKKIVVKIARRF